MMEIKKEDLITISWPNEDGRIDLYTHCPKEVVIKAYTDMVGKTIQYLGIQVKVVEVKVTERNIFMVLEDLSLK